MESTDSSSGWHQQPQLPPGFRFHPTDEELVVHYLKKKASSTTLPVTIIAEINLYKFDPWELPGKANFGEHEWYFFSPRDRKYPNGARPNRAATSGYWKATGTDKPILTSGGTPQKVGVKKALVFYGGKPPKGFKTNWIMHEYRLTDTTTNTTPPNGNKASLRLDDWVLCRIYKKNNSSSQRWREESVEGMHMLAPAALLPIPEQQFRNHPSPQTTRVDSAALLLESDEAFFEGLMSEDTISAINPMIQLAGASRPRAKPNLLMLPAAVLTPKRTSTYWSDAGAGTLIHQPAAKRFHAFDGNNNSSSSSTNDETCSHKIAMLLNQIPQGTTNNYNQATILGALGDGTTTVFRHPYHLSGINSWNS